MGLCAKPLEDGFVSPTEEKLNNLGPGCFVQMNDHGSCCWIEIMEISGAGFQAKAHPALSEDNRSHGVNGKEIDTFAPGAEVIVQREQITALGCDRFCFC